MEREGAQEPLARIQPFGPCAQRLMLVIQITKCRESRHRLAIRFNVKLGMLDGFKNFAFLGGNDVIDNH